MRLAETFLISCTCGFPKLKLKEWWLVPIEAVLSEEFWDYHWNNGEGPGLFTIITAPSFLVAIYILYQYCAVEKSHMSRFCHSNSDNTSRVKRKNSVDSPLNWILKNWHPACHKSLCQRKMQIRSKINNSPQSLFWLLKNWCIFCCWSNDARNMGRREKKL